MATIKEKKAIPAEVEAALTALKYYTQNYDISSDHTVLPELKKALPIIAVKMAKAGENVTVDQLYDHLLKGLEHLKDLAHQYNDRPKPKIRSYKNVVATLKPSPLSLEEQLVDAVTKADLPLIKNLVMQGADIHADQDHALRTAVANGHLEIVKYLHKNGADIHAEQDHALRIAAENGHLDIVKYLHKKPTDINTLLVAVGHGHLKIVKYLYENSADIHAKNDHALGTAVGHGHLEIVKYLHENGADIHAKNDHALVSAATNGHLEIVKYLHENGADIHAYQNHNDINVGQNHTLCEAARKGHLDIVKYLHKNGADIHAGEDYALFPAVQGGNLDIVKYLHENGANIHARAHFLIDASETLEITDYLLRAGCSLKDLSSDKIKQYEQYKLWQKVHPGIEIPDDLLSLNPYYHKHNTYKAAQLMLNEEGYRFCGYSYQIAALFRSEDRILSYLEKWAKQGKQPLHDITHMIQIPQREKFDVKAWGDAILQHGPKLAKFVRWANKVPVPEKSADGRGWSYTKTKEKIAENAFVNGYRNPALASFCLDCGWDDNDFDNALKQIQKYQKKYAANDNAKTKGYIPEIEIDGTEFGKQGYRFYKLPDGDIRGLLLGEFTNCCQHLASQGANCAKHGFLSEHGGFYVVADNENDQIVAQSWVWRGKKGEIVFDSLESLSGHFNTSQWQSLISKFAESAARDKKAAITAVHIGGGGATPKLLFKKTTNLAKPLDYKGYRDSKETQYQLELT